MQAFGRAAAPTSTAHIPMAMSGPAAAKGHCHPLLPHTAPLAPWRPQHSFIRANMSFRQLVKPWRKATMQTKLEGAAGSSGLGSAATCYRRSRAASYCVICCHWPSAASFHSVTALLASDTERMLPLTDQLTRHTAAPKS